MKRRNFLKSILAGAVVAASPKLLAETNHSINAFDGDTFADYINDKDRIKSIFEANTSYIKVGDVISINDETMRVTESVTSPSKGICYSVMKYNSDTYNW